MKADSSDDVILVHRDVYSRHVSDNQQITDVLRRSVLNPIYRSSLQGKEGDLKVAQRF